MRLSKNWLLSRVATLYIEFVRNVPLLLWIFVWYGAVLQPLPGPRQSLNVGDLFFLSNRGLMMPRPIFGEGAWIGFAGLVIAIIASIAISRWAKARQMATGQPFPVFWTAVALIVLLPLLGFAVAGFPISWDVPVLKGFNFAGGVAVIPEFMALFLALSIYTGTYIAEAVRAGIQSVSHGQTEAAHALGIWSGVTLRLVVIPQAMRVIIPPLASTYLSLTKNSSLAVAIGYPDLVATGGTVLNQTGQAVEIVSIWMIVYLSLSLFTSVLMNWFNARMRLVER
jgi:general L-amino acid transport system permease protein